MDPAGYPYGSFVTYVIHEGDPVFLISALAEHPKNLQQNSQASLLIAEATGKGNPLALARVTLLGECNQTGDSERDSVKEAFLAKHPTAEFYVDFKEFSFWELKVASLRYIGGFGRMSWVQSEQWCVAEPDPLADSADGIIAHMNDDHADTMVLYCKTLSKAVDTTAAEMVGLGRYGFEMSAIIGEGPRPIRLEFSKPVSTSEEVRYEMETLAHKGRESSN